MAEGGGIITFADLGIQPPETTISTFIGKVRRFKSLAGLEVAFLILSAFYVLGVSGVTIHRMATMDRSTSDFTVAIVILINMCFGAMYVVHGVFFERPFELVAFLLSAALVWFYGLLNFVLGGKDPYKLARLVTSSLLTPCVAALGLWIARDYHSSKNLIFRTVGANPALQSVCETMFFFFCLLKADLQVCIATAVLIMTSGTQTDTEDHVVLPLVLALALLSFAIGFFSVRYEEKWVMMCYFAAWITMPAYAVYLIVKSAQDLYTTSDNTPDSEGLNAVTFVAVLALLVVRAGALATSVRVFRNFGKGLKDRFYDNTMDKHFQPEVNGESPGQPSNTSSPAEPVAHTDDSA